MKKSYIVELHKTDVSALNEISWSLGTFLKFTESIFKIAENCLSQNHPFHLCLWNTKINLLRESDISIIPLKLTLGLVKILKEKDRSEVIEISQTNTLFENEVPFVLTFINENFSIALVVYEFQHHRITHEDQVEGVFTLSPQTIEKINTDILHVTSSVQVNHPYTNNLQRSVHLTLNAFDQAITQRNHRIHRLWISTQFLSKIAWELDFNRLLGKIADGLKEALQYELLEILLYERVSSNFVEKFRYRRNETKFGGSNLTIELNSSVVKAIYRHRHAIFYEDLSKEMDIVANPKLIHITDLKKAIIVPLVKDRRVQGIIKLFFKPNAKIHQEDVEWMSEMATHITKSMVSAKAHEDATRLASNDALTGIANRRLFNEQIVRDFKRYRRFGGELSVMMVDVDFFKMYNDREGHLQGDQVLKGVARVLSLNIRQTDFLARYGGEEFAIILPGTSLAGASVLAKKINQAIADFKFVNSDKQPFGCITVSIGVSSVINGAMSPEDLLHQADMALYYAKENGRNRTYLYTGSGKFVTPDAFVEQIEMVDSSQDKVIEGDKNN
ncbi:MAG: sensor domain-containing diguanylate cyclase [bacterium]|nr:sensor domain-containing diguanylate cyclase [bacterium]